MSTDDRPTKSSAIRFVVEGHRRTLATVAASGFLGGIAEALFLVIVTRTAFAITDGDDEVTLIAGLSPSITVTLLIGLGLVVLKLLTAAFAGWQSAKMSTSAVADLRMRLARAFLSAEWAHQQDQRSGTLQELLRGYTRHAMILMKAVNSALVAAANLLAMIGLAIAVDPLGASVMVFSVLVLGSLLRPLRAAVRRRATSSERAGMELSTSVSELAELGMELHVFHVQAQAAERLATRVDASREQDRRVEFATALSSPTYTGLAYLALLGALGVVSISSTANLASLGAVMLVMLRSLSYGQALQSAYVSSSGAAPLLDELRRRIDDFERFERHDGGRPVGSVGRIAVDHVSFAYADEQPVLRDISFAIDQREIVGVVGPSGGGKSTLVQLLLGLRDPQQGRILVDGRDIGGLDKSEWSRKVTFVPQAAHLIAGSVADNIRFLRDDVSAADVERAAKLAHLHEDIVGFPAGYERDVGEHGGHLSGGQQQRLCIARALVEEPDVLILDEPTSALDVRSEHLVRETLLGLKERMTVIVIAHRLSTVEICDRIMVIQDGELKAFDTPANLERSSDFYREALALSGMR